MAELNKSIRKCSKVDIRELATKKPFIDFPKANVVTPSFTSDSVFAMADGAKAHAYSNPIDGTLTIEAQIVPFKLYSLMSDGTVATDSIKSIHTTITCAAAGVLTFLDPTGIKEGTVYVYKKGEYGEIPIIGTFASPTFTATAPADIAVDSEYEVAYIITKTSGVRRISFDEAHLVKDYFITLETAEKDDVGVIIPLDIICYKCTPKRTFEIATSSEGDPVTVKLEFDILTDADGKVVDMIENIE